MWHCSTFYSDAKGSYLLSVSDTPRKQSLLCLDCVDISFHLLFSVLFVILHQKNQNFSSKALSFELCNLTRHDSLCFLLVTYCIFVCRVYTTVQLSDIAMDFVFAEWVMRHWFSCVFSHLWDLADFFCREWSVTRKRPLGRRKWQRIRCGKVITPRLITL